MSKEIALKVGLVFYFHNISQIPPDVKVTRHTYIIYISILKHVKRVSAELFSCFVFTEMTSAKC